MKGGTYLVSSPIPGSSAQDVDKKEKKELPPHKIEDGIPAGCHSVDVVVVNLDARIKCSQCETTTLHRGLGLASLTGIGQPISHLRVYTCTVCGHLSTKKA